jgi:hypothetical protein
MMEATALCGHAVSHALRRTDVTPDLRKQPVLTALHNAVAELGSQPRAQWTEVKAKDLQEALELLHAWIRDHV